MVVVAAKSVAMVPFVRKATPVASAPCASAPTVNRFRMSHVRHANRARRVIGVLRARRVRRA